MAKLERLLGFRQQTATKLSDFVHTICTHPDLVCTCGNKALFAELDRVLIIDSPSAQLLSCDTTGQQSGGMVLHPRM